jgi:gliding motility-associated-like protein
MFLTNIKASTIGILVLFLSFFDVQAQKPAICDNLPAGYLPGGRLTFAPNSVACMSLGANTAMVSLENNTSPAQGNQRLSNANYYINVPNNFTIGSSPAKNFVANRGNEFLPAGTHWAILTGEIGTQKYLSCNSIEVLRTTTPDIEVAACSGNTVTFTLKDSPENQYNRYRLDWGDGTIEIINVNASTPLPITKTRTFANTPNQIKVQGDHLRGSIGFCQSVNLGINPVANNPTLLTTLEGENEGAGAKVSFVGFKPGEQYEIEGQIDNSLGTNSWNKLADASNGNATLTGLNPDARYCFRVKATNQCGISVYSQNTLCSINLKGNLNSTDAVDLRWNLPTEPSGIPNVLRLTKDVEGEIGSLNNIPLANRTVTSYLDQGLNCSKKYLYLISTQYPAVLFNGTFHIINIRSAQIKVDPKSNAVAIKPKNLVFVGYENLDERNVRVQIDDPKTGNKYTIYRAINDSQDFQLLTTTNNSVYTDVSITPGVIASYCYKYTVEDQCGIISDFSDPFCTIALSSNSPGNLNWTSYLIPPDIYNSATPVEYEVQYFDEGLNNFIPWKRTNDLAHSIQEILDKSTKAEVKFRINGNQFVDTDLFSGQFISSNSNTFIIAVPPRVFIPSAFTPDGQGPFENETLKIKTKFIDNGTIKIFDRWGGVIFQGLSLSEEWNGTESNGITPAPAGTYAYVIDAVSSTGLPIKMSGSIILLR